MDSGNGNKIEVSVNGQFLLGERDYCIVVVQKGGLLSQEADSFEG